MSGLPAGLSFGTETRRVTGSPTTVQTETVTYTVTDNDGDTDSDTFVWEITDPPDRTPVFGTFADRTNAVNIEIDDVTLPAATNGDPPLTYSIADLPAGLSYDAGTRVVSGTPTEDAINNVTLTARDIDGDEADLVFSWTITVSQAPEYGDILVVGASSVIYNRRDGIWSEGASIPSNNAGGVSVNPATGEIAIVNGAIYYFGEPGDWSPFTLLRDANNSILTAVNGVAHRSDGSIVIVDLRSERWYERTQDETNFNAGTPIPSNESSPQGIGVDADDNIIIVGTSSDRLYTFSGGSWDSGVPFPSGENDLRGVSVAPNGDIYAVGDDTNSYYVLSSGSWSAGVPLPAALTEPQGIAFSAFAVNSDANAEARTDEPSLSIAADSFYVYADTQARVDVGTPRVSVSITRSDAAGEATIRAGQPTLVFSVTAEVVNRDATSPDSRRASSGRPHPPGSPLPPTHPRRRRQDLQQ